MRSLGYSSLTTALRQAHTTVASGELTFLLMNLTGVFLLKTALLISANFKTELYKLYPSSALSEVLTFSNKSVLH